LSRDQLMGTVILLASVVGILSYGWLLFFTEWAMLAIQITAFVAVVALLGILAWIGYTLATTPPPEPIQELNSEISEDTAEKPSDKS